MKVIETTYGATIKSEKSTLKPNHLWLFIRNGGGFNPVKGAVHLDRYQAMQLIMTLEEFIKESNPYYTP